MGAPGDPGGKPSPAPPTPLPSLWDWRRRVADLYGEVRRQSPEPGWRHWRAARDALFREHPQTPLDAARRSGFAGLPLFAYDPAFRFLVDLAAPREREPTAMGAGADGQVVLLPFAETRGLAGPLGAELTLYWIAGYGGGVLLPFRDGTSGSESYAGGRYLLDTIKGADLGREADGRAVLDFNFAYNPSCAYSDAWACPLAPPGNRVPAPVRAGEKAPGANG